ncbi:MULTISPECIES: hypothetical protein [unclassified Rathayibacter]|uniref:hypothetical protein n=1 Tax=unclassified Rathayibacter TaxID=2609250 RepID=UPI00104F4B1A|nr:MULTISPECIES: hypothetical protein [unclassified Rathayibacter]MCJ1703392.1 hypothetical protein [Rathayibacter sp. VKM Ac-2926]TCL80444.1 hypothetical protein EDF49_109165 [Rathayibacter sp. PhB192]TCM25970.1 hypothetical protein EDF43_109165 [Rathayibacter sp. PhB179]
MEVDESPILSSEEIAQYATYFADKRKGVIRAKPYGSTAAQIAQIFSDLLESLSGEHTWAIVQLRRDSMTEIADSAIREIERLSIASSDSEVLDHFAEASTSLESLIILIEEQMITLTNSAGLPHESLRLIRIFSSSRVRFAVLASEASATSALKELSARVDTQVGIAADAAQRAETAAENAARSAGERGATDLESAFSRYAEDENKTSKRFRVSTMTILGVVVAAASALIAVEYLAPGSTSGVFDWRQSLYHLAFLSALSALAAYLARQSTHHRQTAVWAEGIAVQLRSFLAFVDPMNDHEAQSRVYEAFARRVLGSPPDLGKSVDETGATQLLTSIAELITRRPN